MKLKQNWKKKIFFSLYISKIFIIVIINIVIIIIIIIMFKKIYLEYIYFQLQTFCFFHSFIHSPTIMNCYW